MSEQTDAGEPKQEPKHKPIKLHGPKGEHMLEILVGLSFVVLLLLAAWSYSSFTKEQEDVLSVSIAPEDLAVHAGEDADLVASATFNDEPVDDAATIEFSWSVSLSLGSFDDVADRMTTFTAGSATGNGQIVCAVTYTVDDNVFTSSAEVALQVLEPVLEHVTIETTWTTLLYNEVGLFNATAYNTLAAAVPGSNFTWTVEGISVANYTLNSTYGACVNFTANATGTAWVNVTASHGGVNMSASVSIHIIPEVPVADISRTRITDGFQWTFTEPSGPLAWDDVIVYLTDGTDIVNWSLSSAGLNNGSSSSAGFGYRMLGALNISLNATDLTGNSVINASDYFTFTATGGRFNPIKDYVVTLVFEPKTADIVSKTFQG